MLIPWVRIEVFVAAVALLVVFYRPPKAFAGLRDFVERHFGDSLGLYILHLGIGLVVLGGFYVQAVALVQVGQSLIMASMVALKLKTVPGAGTNGNGGKSVTATTTESTVVTKRDIKPEEPKPEGGK